MHQVLVVDDDPFVADALVALLALEEIPAMTALDRVAAEELIAGQYFPIILADLRLRSEEDGLLLLEHIRSLSPQSRVATLTGYATESLEAKLRELGSRQILFKPIGSEELISIVRELLSEIERAEVETPDLEQLYLETRRLLHALPRRRYGLTADDAEELVQEAWCLYLEHRENIRSPKSWLSGTVLNLCKQSIRQLYRRRDRETELPADWDEGIAPTTDVALTVEQALTRLDDRGRMLFDLIAVQACSYDEVSEQMRIPVGSVGPTWLRTREKLRKAIG